MFSEIFRLDHIMGVCEKICYFLAVNLCFLVSCFPVLLFFLFVGISQAGTYLPLFCISLLSVPPAFSAMLYAMKKLAGGLETGGFRDYFKGYAMDFRQKLCLGAAHIGVIFIFYTNYTFFAKQYPVLPLAMVFLVLFLGSLIITPNLYLLVSRYKMGNLRILKTALILTITRPVNTLGTTAAMGVMLAVFECMAGTAVLFIGSLYAFLVVYISQKMQNSLEKEQE